MLHTDSRFTEAVEAAVAEIETRTDAELIVVAAERSGSYRDAAGRAAFWATLVVAAVILWVPHYIAEPWVLLDLTLSFFGFEWAFRSRRIVPLITRASRRESQVEAAAEREFHREAVHGTPNRSGVLVYVSALEGVVRVLPDLGVQGRLPGGALLAAIEAFRHDDLDHFLEGLRALGDALEVHVPHIEGSDDIDLPNTPRVRP
jgi:putative membrane protein